MRCLFHSREGLTGPRPRPSAIVYVYNTCHVRYARASPQHPYLYTCPPPHSITTTAPSAFSVATMPSPSSFGTASRIIFGAPSTNFLLSTKLRPSMLLISLITFGFAAASKLCSFRLNSVFSSCFAGASSSSAGAAAAGADGPAAKPPTGRSGMLRRLCGGWSVDG